MAKPTGFTNGIPLPLQARQVDISAADDELPGGVVRLVVGTNGILKVDDAAGNATTWSAAALGNMNNVLVGQWTKVYKTGTTAADIYVQWYAR